MVKKLYHYSFDDNVLVEGLEPSVKHEDTNIINELIYSHSSDYFGRDYCIFFNMDNRDDGDFTVSVDISDLDCNNLFVANQDIANEIYATWYRGNNTDKLVADYISSIKKYSEYAEDYVNPELFYTDYIGSNILKKE